MNAISPTHYQSHPSGLECIEIARHQGFLIGSALKYLWRSGLKDKRSQELGKVCQYLEWARADRVDIHFSDTTRQWQTWYLNTPDCRAEDHIINMILSGNLYGAWLSASLLLLEVER